MVAPFKVSPSLLDCRYGQSVVVADCCTKQQLAFFLSPMAYVNVFALKLPKHLPHSLSRTMGRSPCKFS